jgi:CheY-like chemotaxis protein
MGEEHAEILVVDDDRTYARTLAEWLQNRVPQGVTYTDSKDKAIELIRSTYVRIAILDQRMRQKLGVDGTQLAAEIREIDERVRVIILSGESDQGDYEKSNELLVRHLKKGENETLLRVIALERQTYLLKLESGAKANAEVIGRYRPWTLVRRPAVVFNKILEEAVSTAPEVDEADFRTLVHVDAGQSFTHTVTSVYSHEIEIEAESTQELASTGVFNPVVIAELTTSLKAAIRERSRTTITQQQTHTSEQHFEVPEKDRNEGVLAYELQEAWLYHRKRALIQVCCDCCGHKDIVTVGFREPTGKVQRRRVDFLTGDRKRITNIGTR